jgi:anti-sigma factor RsiW
MSHHHLTDEDLVLHYYGEGPVEQESLVDEHLQSCPECQTLWQEITGTLRLVDAARVPEPAADFEQTMWARVQEALPAPGMPGINDTASFEQFRERRISRRVVVRYVMPAIGIAAAVLLAVFVGRNGLPESRPAATAPAPAVAVAIAAPDVAGRERVLLTALDEHFQRSEMLLVEVMNGAAAVEQIGFERQTADELLDSSRIYRVLAQQSGKVRLADMLEEIESVLVEIARSPEKVDRKDFGSLRARIQEDDLLFKVRAVSKQIQDRQRSLSTE